jgi:hypothetical protein
MKHDTQCGSGVRPHWLSVALAFAWVVGFSILNFMLEFIKEFEGNPEFGYHCNIHWHRKLSYPLIVDAWLWPAFILAAVILAKDRFVDPVRIGRWNGALLAFCAAILLLGVVSYCETFAVMHQWAY